jgi:hypothetical protein
VCVAVPALIFLVTLCCLNRLIVHLRYEHEIHQNFMMDCLHFNKVCMCDFQPAIILGVCVCAFVHLPVFVVPFNPPPLHPVVVNVWSVWCYCFLSNRRLSGIHTFLKVSQSPPLPPQTTTTVCFMCAYCKRHPVPA